MTKRISILVLAVVIVVIIVLVVLISTQGIFNLSGGKEKSDDQIISTVLIERRDLRTFEKIDGVLEYGSEVQVLPSSNGVLTHIISEGADVFRGTVLFKYYKSVTDSEILTVNNQFASADSGVAQAKAALELLTFGPTDAQVASADSGVAQAEAALESLISGPTDSQVASANSGVAQAEAALELLTSGPTESQIASADSAVSSAESSLDLLTSSPTESQIASADSAVAQTEAALVNSQALVDTQWVTFRIARQAYCDLSGKLGSSVWTAEVYKSVCPDTEKIMTVTAAEFLLDSMFDETLLITNSNDLLVTYENHKKGVETEVSSTKALESARAQRSALDDAPRIADLNKANKALESARAQRSALDDAPTTADLNKADKALESARAQRLALDDAPTTADLNKADKALESAKASLKLAEHNRDELVEGIATTVAMYGQQPAWRSFEIGMSEGLDIFQLEQNLVALGYDETNSVLVDQEFDEHSRKAIETMQSLLGVSVTGELKFRDILFVPGPSVVQYSDSHAEIGVGIITSTPILSLIPIEKIIKNTGDEEVTKSLQKVNTSIEVVNKNLVELDLIVSIELPDESIISGTISDIGDIAVIPQGNQGEPYLEIIISLEDTVSLPEWTGATVTVSVTKKLASGVLAAPVTSLLAILGGGYAIEIIENSVSRLVPVSVGLYADGWVEIKGDGIKVGTEVVVP
jgi:ethanolamine utilization microcompartment shell protein EutS